MGFLTPTIGRIKLKNGYEKIKVSIFGSGFVHNQISYNYNPKKIYRAKYVFGLITANTLDYTEGIPEPCDFYNRRLPVYEYVSRSDVVKMLGDERKDEIDNITFDASGFMVDEIGYKVPKTDEYGKYVYKKDDNERDLLGGEFVEYMDNVMTPNAVGNLIQKLAKSIKNFEYYMLGGIAVNIIIAILIYRMLDTVSKNINAIITYLNTLL